MIAGNLLDNILPGGYLRIEAAGNNSIKQGARDQAVIPTDRTRKRVPEQLNKTTRAVNLCKGAFSVSLTLANG